MARETRTADSSTPTKDAAAPAPVAAPTGVEEVFARASPKDRASIQRHLTAVDAEPDRRHGQLWRRLAKAMAALAPLPPQTLALDSPGQHATLFFVPDGKYRMQVFALEDRRDGVLQIYLPNVLDKAVKAKVLRKKGNDYTAAEGAGGAMPIQTIEASSSADPPKHFKNLIGWNRKAVRVTLDVTATDSLSAATTEKLCELAAKEWTKAP